MAGAPADSTDDSLPPRHPPPTTAGRRCVPAEPQDPRRTVVIGNRAARNAGVMPPMTPTAMAHPRPSRIDSGVTRNAKANWDPAAGLSVDAV